MKKNVVMGLLVIFLIISFIGCGDKDNDPEIYTVTIGTLTNANGSKITANPTNGVEGTEITLTITEDNTYRLKSGTLKFGIIPINEITKKFKLPAENVTITAEFQSLLIGDWINETNTNIYTFFENGIYAVSNIIYYDNKFIGDLGTWLPQNDKIIILTETHNGNQITNYQSIYDFKDSDKIDPHYIYACEVLTNKSIKMIFKNVVTGEVSASYIYTLIE